MTDTERLNLIEHYRWNIHTATEGYTVFGDFGNVGGKSLREAIDAALRAQFEWSVGR